MKRVGTGIINASIKLSVQRELELWLKPRVDLRILRKLTKSKQHTTLAHPRTNPWLPSASAAGTSASAVRKAEKHGRVYAVGHIGFTAAWGCLLSNAAVFVAEETMLAWITLWRRLRKQRKKLQGKDTGDQHLPRVLRVSHQRHCMLTHPQDPQAVVPYPSLYPLCCSLLGGDSGQPVALPGWRVL